MRLPDRDFASEEAFVAALRDLSDATTVVAAMEAAFEERRPKLAARLVALLGEDVSDELIERARRARGLRVESAPDFDPWDDAFAEFVKRRSRRRWVRNRRGRR